MLKEKIASELKEAMKARDELRLSVFRMLSSAVHNKEIEKRTRRGSKEGEPLSDEEIIQVIRSEVKKRKDAVLAYEQGGRPDAAGQEEKEGEILAELLPQDLSDEELEKIISQGMAETGAGSAKDFGRLMAWVMGQAKGRSSGERVAQAIKVKLSAV